MSDVALRLEHVYKKFRRGELHDSLRDQIPAMIGRMLRRPLARGELTGKQEFWALQDVSFEVQKGEAFGIIGHNGAGKSTILKILSGVMKPTKGSMTVSGRLSALIEVSAGFHPDLTGRENIYLNGTILGMRRREIDSKLDAIIEFSGLADFIDTPVKRYSSGMYARLGFSIAAHVDPDVMIVDEVLSVGDHVFQQKCLNRMMEIIRNGTTVLFVSHNLRAVMELCQRSLLLDHGKTLMIGPTASVIKGYMDAVRNQRKTDENTAVTIDDVTVTGERGESIRFDTGERVRVRIEVTARQPVKDFSLPLYIRDEDYRVIFDTSTRRLGRAYDLEPGDKLRCEYEIDLAMGPGTYQICVSAYRHDKEEFCDYWDPAATLYIGSPVEAWKGIIACKPRIVGDELIAS